jgi:hypothetical protein
MTNAGIDAPKLHTIGNLASVMARSDAQFLGAGVKTAWMFAGIDASKLHPIGNLASVMARSDAQFLGAGVKTAWMFAGIDASRLHPIGNLAELVANVNMPALHGPPPTRADLVSAILDAPELAAAAASASFEEADPLLASEGPVARAVDAPHALREADPLGLIFPRRELSEGEWALLSTLVSCIAIVAMNTYHVTPDETAAISVIAFFLVRAALSSSRSPWISPAPRVRPRSHTQVDAESPRSGLEAPYAYQRR